MVLIQKSHQLLAAAGTALFQRTCFTFFVFGLLMGPLSFAETIQKSDSNKSQKEVSPKDSRQSVDTEAQGLRQGFSVQESLILGGDSKWSSMASTGLSRTLDELAYTAWTVGGNLGYRLTEKDSLNASLSYRSRTDLEAPDPTLFGISDLALQWLKVGVWQNPVLGSVSSQVTWSLPTSTLSQRETLVSSLTSGLSFRKTMPVQSALKNVTWLGSASVILAAHQYDRRVRGTTVNSPFGVSYSAGATYALFPRLNLSGSFGMYHRMDYEGFVQDIQTVSVRAVAILPQSYFLTAGYYWRDTVVTNDPFLFADKTAAFVELSRAF